MLVERIKIPDKITKVKQLQNQIEEKEKRDREAIRVFRAFDREDMRQVSIFESQASELLIRGGKRSSKSVCAAILVGAIATKQDVRDEHGRVLNIKRPSGFGQDVVIWCIGWDEKHIGQTIYRLLFKPGLFRVIKDKKTGGWRAFNPADPKDVERLSESKPAEPVIPKRFIEKRGFAWTAAGKKVFSSVRLKDGTTIYAFSSKGHPKMGDAVDVIWIDEDIENEGHVSEWQDRLADRKGRLIWSAWPHTSNNAILLMGQRAEEQRGSPNPDIEDVQLVMTANPFIDDEEKRKSRGRSQTEDEWNSRNRGDFLISSVLMYPEFNVDVHGLSQGKKPVDGDVVAEYFHWLAGRHFPAAWTRYIWLDPGHTKMYAGLFVVPPPTFMFREQPFGRVVILEDEVFLQRKDRFEFAAAIKQKAGNRVFQKFGIDWHAGRQTPLSGGLTYHQLYAEAFKQVGLKSIDTRHSFIFGSDDIPARTTRVHDWMMLGENGFPIFRVCTDRTPRFLDEIRRYKKKVTQDETQDVPIGKDNDAMNVLEYAAAQGCEYVYRIHKDEEEYDPVYREFLRKRKRSEASSPFCHLGPGGGLSLN